MFLSIALAGLALWFGAAAVIAVVFGRLVRAAECREIGASVERSMCAVVESDLIAPRRTASLLASKV